MSTFKIIWFVITSLIFSVCGWLFLFRTNMVVGWGRKNYGKGKRRVANLGQDIVDVRLSGFVYGYLVPIKPVPNSDVGEGASSSFC